MRYVRTKLIITTVFDGDIDDISEIQGILKSLCAHEIDTHIEFENGTFHNRARIIGVYDGTFRFLVIGSRSSVVLTEKIENIRQMEVSTNDQHVVCTKPGITRWNLINPAGEFA